MKNYLVRIPFAGSISIPVEAENEDKATEAAWEKTGFTVKPDHEDCEIDEVECLDYVVQGNVCSAPLWGIEVEEE